MSERRDEQPPSGRDAGRRAGEQAARAPVSARHAPRWKTRARLRVLLVALLLAGAVGGVVWFLSVRYWTTPVTPIRGQPTPETLSGANANGGAATPQQSPAAASPGSMPTPADAAAPAPSAGPTPQGTPAGAHAPPSPGSLQLPLLVPVAGVRPEDLQDTYTQSRSNGRTHDAIDIIAPRGTPVLAAADGRVVKLVNSVPGGITVYQLATDDKTILYYAHLDRYADGLAEGHFARRGETIGYVGDTGNAGAGNYHLHFSVSITTDPKRWWGGANVNPYPLFRGQGPGAGGQ